MTGPHKTVKVFDVAKLQRWINELERQEPKETAAARREYKKYVTESWKNPQSSVTGDPWIDAVIALGEHDDIEPLISYLDTTPVLAEQLHDLKCILRMLHARGRKHNRGRPDGTLWRWTHSNYLTAWIAEQRIAIWKLDTGKHNISDKIRNEIISNTVAEARTWHFAKRKPPSVDRGAAILKGPRSRRLPVLLPG